MMNASCWTRKPLPLFVVVGLVAFFQLAAEKKNSCHAFLTPRTLLTAGAATTTTTTSTRLNDWFDNRFGGKGSASKSDLDDQWEAQQEILRARRAPKSERDKYFKQVEERRAEASAKQNNMWSWQTKQYKKGEDPIDEWKKRRADGSISDLDDQYGDEKKMGGIPLPMASFGVGGEFGVGGKFDNGGRFDLRLPYADQGYVSDDADVMGKLSSLFGGGGKKVAAQTVEKPPCVPSRGQQSKQQKKEDPPKKKGWPW